MKCQSKVYINYFIVVILCHPIPLYLLLYNSTCFYPFVPIGSLRPFSCKRVCPPCEPKGGGDNGRLRVRGQGEPILMTGENVYSVVPSVILKCICNYLFHLVHNVINIQFGKWDWRQLGYNLNATGRQLHVFFASRMKFCQFFSSMLQKQLLNLKMKTPFKNPRIYAKHVLAKCYPSALCIARSNSWDSFANYCWVSLQRPSCILW